jgi:hypothetical protein
MGYKILNKCMNLKVNYNTFRITRIMLIVEIFNDKYVSQD